MNIIQKLTGWGSLAEPIRDPSTINNPIKRSRWHFSFKLAETILIKPVVSSVELTTRIIKLLTWDATKASTLKVFGYHKHASTYWENHYLKAVRVARNILFTPSVAYSAFNDVISRNSAFVDDLKNASPQNYLSVDHVKKFDIFSSYMHGRKTFEVIQLPNIKEFAAESDGALNTVMASHFLKPGMLAINFGIPNVATFNTESKENVVQTYKVDAKSLKRAKMTYHPTNGKIQSGVFFVPRNLPAEALERYKEAAEKLQGRADLTCVNTNCRVLQEAGFSIEGKKMDKVVFPTTFMEHLMFRNFFYTDTEGKNHRVYFDIINTTRHTLEEHFEKLDLAVVGTRFRHRRRNADAEENSKIRGIAARALIAEEKQRLANVKLNEPINENLTKRKITVSVPSYFGSAIARVWGRHTLYEVDLSDKKERIAQRFEKLALLAPFPQKKPSFVTRLKRDLFFSQRMINFLRRHVMGHKDSLNLNTQDLLSHLKSTKGERLNYVILGNKVVLARVKVNAESKDPHRKVADWALSKHALLSGRQKVHCSGEVWYDKEKDRFMMNGDSGTYMPNPEHVVAAAEIINEIFQIQVNNSSNIFEVAEATV